MQGRPGQGRDNREKESPTAARIGAIQANGKYKDSPTAARIAAMQASGKYKDSPTAARIAAIQATGKLPTLPQRPPGMAHLDTPPETLRVPRPKWQASSPKKLHKRIIILGSLGAIVTIIAVTIVLVLVFATSASNGAATTANDFLNALSNSNYDQAFKDLGSRITIRINEQQFIQQAQGIDRSYGRITNYQEVANSATSENNGTLQSYTYTITRSNLKKTYQLHLTLQQDPDDPNTWKVIDYGTSLAPV